MQKDIPCKGTVMQMHPQGTPQQRDVALAAGGNHWKTALSWAPSELSHPWVCPSWGSPLPMANVGRDSAYLEATLTRLLAQKLPLGLARAVLKIPCLTVQLFFQPIPATSSPRLGPDHKPQGWEGSIWGRQQSQPPLCQAVSFSLLFQSILLPHPTLGSDLQNSLTFSGSLCFKTM